MAVFRILYVDDEPGLLELGKIFLEQGGHFTVDTILSAPEALALLGTTRYDAIVADYQMPGMDGIEFLKKVRKSGNIIPFILFTGRGREQVVIQALNEGADFYIQKGGEPLSQFAELAHKIRQAIQRRLAEGQIQESQTQLRTIVNSIPVGIVTIDATTHRILNANPKAVVMIGAEPDAIVGQVCHTFICPAQAGACPVTDCGQTVDLSERILLDRNGTRIPILKSVVRTVLDGRDVLVESFFDLTGEKQTEEEVRQKNARLSTLNDLEREFAELPAGQRVESLAAKKLSVLSGAVVTVFCTYDPVKQVQNVAAMEYAPGTLERLPGALDKVARWLGTRPEDLHVPIKKETYLDFRRSIVGMKKTITEISNGYIPPLVGATIQKFAGIDRFFYIAHIIDGELYGTSVIGMKPGQPDPEREILESFAHLVATSLRRQQAEAALRESEDRYRTLIENADEAILVVQDNRICFANPKLVEISGYAREEYEQKPFLEFIHPDDRKLVGEQHRKRLSGKPLDEHYIFRILGRGGSVLWTEIRSSRISWNGQTAVLAILQDITERKNTEEALRDSEAKFRAAVDQSIDGIIIVDFTGKLLFANNSVAHYTGYDLDLVGKMNVLDIVAPEFRLQAMKDFALVAAGTDSYLAEYKILGAGKKELSIECIAKKISFAGSAAMILSIRDITGRRTTEDALRQANRQFSLLTGITRHDILNKISVITGFLAIAAMKNSDPVMGTYLKKIGTATDAIKSQIEFTRLYHDLGTLQPQWLSLDEIMPRSHVPPSITLNAEGKEIRVLADPMLEKVFSNLLDNTIRHGQRVSTIRVTTRQAGEDLVVIWEDDGVGIPADEKERIFERGFGKNTGLGMFLAREVLSLTKITITETGEPGKGARFEITVPKGAYRVGGE